MENEQNTERTVNQINLVRFRKLVNPVKLDDAHATLVLQQVNKTDFHVVRSASSRNFYNKWHPEPAQYIFKQGTFKGVPVWKIYEQPLPYGSCAISHRWTFYSIDYIPKEEANKLLLLDKL